MGSVYSDNTSVGGGFAGGPGWGGPGWGGGGMGLEALILLALFGGRDGFGRGDGGHCRDGGAGDSTAALATVIAALNDRGDADRCETVLTAILAKLGSVEGQIPAISCELQAAITNATVALTAQGNANAASLTAQLNSLQLGQLVQSNAIQTAIAAVDTNVDRQSCETRGAIFQSEARLTALINAQETARLTAANIALENKVTELLSDARHAQHTHATDSLRIEIRNNNEATAQQAQFQRQRQEDNDARDLRFSFERLHNRLDIIDSQFARATNSSVNVGNLGAVTTPQTNTNTQVRP